MSMNGALPLSHMQQGMLFQRLSGQTPGVDLEQIVGELDHPLDPECFTEAWRRVAALHSALRTVFRWRDRDEPAQEVLTAIDLPVRLEDWRDREPDEQRRAFEAEVAADRAAGFTLDSGPLTRVFVARVGEAAYRMLWSFPHILMDGRSFPIVLREVFDTHDALVRGAEPALPDAPSCAAFLEWLDRRDASGDLAHWAGVLGGFRAATPLPGVAGRAPGDRGELSIRLSPEATRALRDFATAAGATSSSAVHAAWGLLLARHAGERDVVFGGVRSGRKGTVPGADDVVGVFINTLPVRIRLTDGMRTTDVLRSVREQQVASRPFEHAPLVAVQRASDVPAGQPLFESIVVFDHETLGETLRRQGGAWERRRFELLERTAFPLTLYAYAEDRLLLKLSWDEGRLTREQAEGLLARLRVLLESMPAHGDRPVVELPMLPEAERRRLLVEWNDTRRDIAPACMHELFEAQARRTPDAVAAVFEGTAMTFRGLDEAANRLAHHLRSAGVGPDILVGLCVERSLELIIGVLGIHKAGGAYVPLDPEYPVERLEHMIRDSGAPVVVTQDRLMERLPAFEGVMVRLDGHADAIAARPATRPEAGARPEHLAYAIYTSGSSGSPKGVLVEHRNAANFFGAMDERLGAETDGAFLAVTSLSFDISVLELFWTLCRGQKVVVFDDDRGAPASAMTPSLRRSMAFSLFYFSSDESTGGDKYRLLKEGARFADTHGFEAVWTPERHFHAFGGLFPNPSVTSAALAVMTERVKIRSGSVVLPLHHPVRVAEEWSVVDNLSNGRVGLSIASGWQPDDFVLRPESHADRSNLMYEQLDQLRRLWRGEALPFPGPKGDVDVRILPRPIQPELPVWITTAGSPETFRRAGEIGANILTHLLGQTLQSLGQNLAVYREARRAAGHEGAGRVTLMLHTFVGDDRDAVRELVREPMKSYLRSAVSLVKNFAAEWTAYSKRARSTAPAQGDEFSSLSKEDLDSLLDFAFERYFETSGLFGTVETCREMIEDLKAVGVDEVGCLIDFGVEPDLVLHHLEHLDRLREASNAIPEPAPGDYSLMAQVVRHDVTTMQCTPSMAAMLMAGRETRRALGAMHRILLGGEPLPPALARELRGVTRAEVVNMYGPTETTVWSSTHTVAAADDPVPIGVPVANTTFYVLDEHLQPVPIGVSGELYIGGRGVVRGYHDRPDLTAQRFLADPFDGAHGARMYRTGDLVRWREDGTLDFLGRLDDQVKLRGHRIELGEIESVLERHAAVRQVVVVVRPDASGQGRLIAYVVPKPGARPAPAELRELARRTLPEFMVPSTYVSMAELPLTPNAKVDRKALPEAEPAQERDEPFVEPGNRLERVIAEIWRETLDVPVVGRRDNFFDLGGHSLLTVQVHNRLRKDLGRDLALTDLFRFPTVQSLAAHLSNGDGGNGGAEAEVAGLGRAEARKRSMLRRQQSRAQ